MVISEGDRASYGDIPCDEDQPEDWHTQSCVQFRVRKFLRSSIACMQVFLGEITILSIKGLQWDADKLKDLIFGALLRLRYCCAGPYPCWVCLSDGSLWSIVADAAEPTFIAGLALSAVRHYLAWCFLLPIQEFAPEVVGLWLQVLSLLDRVCIEAGYFLLSLPTTECQGN